MAEYIDRHDALNFDAEIVVDPDQIEGITAGMAYYADYLKKLPVIRIRKGVNVLASVISFIAGVLVGIATVCVLTAAKEGDK